MATSTLHHWGFILIYRTVGLALSEASRGVTDEHSPNPSSLQPWASHPHSERSREEPSCAIHISTYLVGKNSF